MSWLEKITRFLIKLREFLFLHPKAIFLALGIIIALAALAFTGLYFRQKSQLANANIFYEAVLHKLPATESIDAKVEILAKLQKELRGDFFPAYVFLEQLDYFLAKKDTEALKKLLANQPEAPSDQIVADLFKLKLAEGYRTLQDYDKALSLLGTMRSPALEELQLFNSGKIYFEKKDYPRAVANLQSLNSKFPNSPLKPFVEGYLSLAQGAR